MTFVRILFLFLFFLIAVTLVSQDAVGLKKSAGDSIVAAQNTQVISDDEEKPSDAAAPGEESAPADEEVVVKG